MISRILVTLRCGFEVLFYVDLLLYILLFSYVLLYFASEVNFSSQFGRLTQITRVYAMLLLLKKVIAGLERYFSSKKSAILWLYDPKQQIRHFLLSSGPARYRFSHLHRWSFWTICYWNWEHRCRVRIRHWEAFAQGLWMLHFVSSCYSNLIYLSLLQILCK